MQWPAQYTGQAIFISRLYGYIQYSDKIYGINCFDSWQD